MNLPARHPAMSERLALRWLPYETASGPQHMAADETLLLSAVAGTASLRWYGWSEATVSLGYFQPERCRQQDPQLAGLPYVRRPSGGALLVHHQEITYALALPAAWVGRSASAWLWRWHQVLATALRRLGLPVEQQEKSPPAGAAEEVLCFRQPSTGDLLLSGAKIVGSAQRRHRGALLQHGSLLLAASPYAPSLPGIRELTSRQLDLPALFSLLNEQIQEQLSWQSAPGDWTAEERACRRRLVEEKYSQASWNARR